MSKVRVYELAKETGLANKEVLRRLIELGVDAKSHSSSVEEIDARRFVESLGKTQADKEEAERRRRDREAEELARFKDVSAVAPPERKKAAKVLPPHLRKQQEEPETAAHADAPAAPADATEPTPVDLEAPPVSAEADELPAARLPGAPPPVTDGAARRAAPTTRMPGAPPPPTATGAPPRPRRIHEPSLPQEGSGKRAIPPPIRPAPARQPVQPGRPPVPGRPAPGRGAPPPGRRPESPYRQPVGRAGPPATPGGPPGAFPPGRGGPGGPGGPGAPGRGAPPTGKKRRKKKQKQAPEEQALDMRPQRRDLPLEEQVTVDRVAVLSGVTVGELADKLGVAGAALVKKLFEMGEMVTVQQTLPDDTVEIVCADLGVAIRFMTEAELEFGLEEPDDPGHLVSRPPVVTVMGHVDHGKTLLLDAIRQTDVVSQEAGGITQHIGAYQVQRNGRLVTFIDTPGHEAFTAMRARGAQVTDVAVLVVAADDGVMPQTVEAINHAKAAEVPIVVAVNKIDRENAQPDRVKQQLADQGLIPEEWGGETPMVHVSAMTKEGLEDLLEIILLQADIMELQANPTKSARGRVIEAHLDKGRGPVATVLVEAGTLRPGVVLVAGTAEGRIRAMFDENGSTVDEASPARPVQVLGLNDVPEAGDEFRVVEAERHARDIAERRGARERRRELAEHVRPKTLEDLTAEVEAGEKATLNIIIKADVSGSAEALEDALGKLELDEVQVRVVHKGVGAVTENDVTLAQASDAIIVAFNVRPGAHARDLIERSGVDLRSYRIIYEAIQDIEQAVKGLLSPKFEEVVVGEAEVREVFRVPRAGFVFGCMVTGGEVRRGSRIRVVREGTVVAEDRVGSLRRFKDDVREVSQGYECGIGLDKFQDVKVGDVLEMFEQREVERV